MADEGDPTERSPAGLETPSASKSALVVAVVKDLFFVARIGETARLAGVPLQFAKTPEALEAVLSSRPRFVLVDLTAALDHDQILTATERAEVPVLGFTTHALARQTQPWHERCARVVTKETLTQELPHLLQTGIASKAKPTR
jgi:hypothetical protein